MIAVAGATETAPRVALELAAPAEWNTYPNGINKLSEISGFRTMDGEQSRAIVWHAPESEAEILPMLEGDDYSWAGWLNDKGVIPGNSGLHAVLWKRDHTIIDLSARLPVESSRSSAWRVSNRGVAVGELIPAGTNAYRAVVWPKKGTAFFLPFDDTVYAVTRAYAINDKGVTAGAATLLPAGRPYHAVYWTKRHEMVDLHSAVVEALPTVVASAAQDVMKDGRIVGFAWETVVGQDAPVQWSWVFEPRHGTLHVLDGGESPATTAWVSSGKRYVAGYLDGDWLFDTWDANETRAALWTRRKSGKSVDWTLSIVDTPDGMEGFALWGVNEKGALTGIAKVTDGLARAHYVPPPKRKRK